MTRRTKRIGTAMKRSGFTLIELLVVIGIIGILIGLVFPALRRAQARSRQAACMNTLHQFGLAIVQYRHDHDDNMPLWLSALYPDYFSSKSSYLCPSDGSRGAEGGKPDNLDPNEYNMGSQFSEADDKDGNTYAGTNRCADIPACSYFYEFCDAPCDANTPQANKWWVGYVDMDTNSTATWCEIKQYQLNHGDKWHPAPYNETDFPMVRCFHHLDEKETRSKDYDTNGSALPMKWDHLTLNLSYSGNVFPAPIKWEWKP